MRNTEIPDGMISHQSVNRDILCHFLWNRNNLSKRERLQAYLWLQPASKNFHGAQKQSPVECEFDGAFSGSVQSHDKSN